jgi:hypothetical protein
LATAIWSAENKTALPKARYPSGKGEVCKTFMRRFDPGPRLQFFLDKSNISSELSLASLFVPVRSETAKIGPI